MILRRGWRNRKRILYTRERIGLFGTFRVVSGEFVDKKRSAVFNSAPSSERGANDVVRSTNSHETTRRCEPHCATILPRSSHSPFDDKITMQNRFSRLMKKPRKPKQSPQTVNSAARYREPLSPFARRLIREWRRLALPPGGDKVVVAVSGGADSVALLLALDELVRAGKIQTEIVLAHLNHKLRQAAATDARWVESLAKQLGHRVVVSEADVNTRARKSNDNLEQAARRLRYEFLGKVARSNGANLVLTGHTMNDQAETVLLNLIRGSGSDGLRGIEPLRRLVSGGEIILARPLVSWASRADTESYCRRRSISYREDVMNLDESFARVRVRRQLLPLLEQFNPRFIQSVTRSAQILREDNVALDAAAARLLELSAHTRLREGEFKSLRGDLLRAAPAALRRRALRLWLGDQRGHLRRIEHAHIIAIEKLLLSNKSGRVVELPGGAQAFRQNSMLHYRPGSRPK